MRILIYGINYSPELVGIGKYTGEMSQWLSSRGHQIRVITAPPYYPAWKIGSGYSPRKYRSEGDDVLRVFRCPLWVPAKPTGLRRIFHLLSFALSSLPVALWQGLTWRPDAVIVLTPALTCAPAGWLAARLGGARAWLHVQDLELDAAFDLGLLPSASCIKFAFWLETLLLRRFDRVSSISRRMLDQLRLKGVSSHRLLLFPNWTDTDAICPGAETDSLRSEFGIAPDATIAMYSGNMGEKQGLEIVIDAAHLLRGRPDVTLLLCGDGAARIDLQARAAGLENVRFVPLQPLERLNQLLNLADIHLLPQRADAADLVMPSKLSGILSCGGAVIATASPWTELARTVNDAGGLVCKPGDVQQFAGQILELAGDPAKRKQMSEQARQYAITHLQKSTLLKRFETALCACCEATPLPSSVPVLNEYADDHR